MPDGYFLLHLGDRRALLFLESDRATVSNKRRTGVLASKAYTESGKYQQRYRTISLRILTVTTTPKRLSNRKKTTEHAGGGKVFWFTTIDKVTQHAVLNSAIWSVPAEAAACLLVSEPALRNPCDLHHLWKAGNRFRYTWRSMPGGSEREHGQAAEIDARNLLDQGVEQLLLELQRGRSERLERYLAFTARFHHYSANNQMLIYIQCPHASFVAGYRTWQEMGYQVAKAQKGIRILAPQPHKRTNKETGEEEQVLSFRTVSVFDVSQLVNVAERPLPTFFAALSDDQQALYEKLVQAIREDGISIVESWTGLAQGYSAGKKIVLREGMDSRNRVLTLIHEYVHELRHWGIEAKDQPRQVQECHAEAVAFVVAHRFGIHSPYSADYLQNWGTTPQELKAELEVVRKTAAYIIDRVEKPEANPPTANDPGGIPFS